MHIFNLYILNFNYLFIFGRKEEFYSDKNSTKKYSVGIIDMIKLRNIYNTYTYIPIYIQLNTHIYMEIKKHKQSKKLRFYNKKNIYIKKRSMYNMIHANQQDIHWKQYSLFNVDQVDEHEKYKS